MSDLKVKKLNTQEAALIIPFDISAQQASHIFARQISRNKLNPTEVFEAARQGKVRAVYFPAYKFDCKITTRLSAECTKREGEQLSTFTAYRELESEFSQIVISAGDKVDSTLFSLLEPYNLEALCEFKSDLAQNAEIQQPAVSAEEIFERIRPEIEQEVFFKAKNSLADYTGEKVTNNSYNFTDITATHLLLPMWVLNCEYQGQPCRLFMNGQTGKTAGVPPRSTTKMLAFLGAGAAIGATLGQLIWMAVKSLW